MRVHYDDSYTHGIHPDARFPRERYVLTHEALVRRGAPIQWAPPTPVGRDDVVRAHDPAYVDAFLDFALDRQMQRRIGLRPWTEAIVPRTLRLTGGTLGAVQHAVATGGLAGNLAGGTHHAFRDRGGGYCVFNDLAIGALWALEEAGLSRVAVVDLDVHQGDGTAAIFADDPRVFTLSMHCAVNYPFRKQVSDLDVALPEGTDDSAYLEALDAALPRAFDTQPDLVLFQAGVDGLATDRLGKLALTREGMAARNARVLDAVDAAGVPCVIAMGGGYGTDITTTVEALADLYEAAARRG